MKVFRVVAVIALMTGPAYAQTLIQSFESKTPQQKADEELKEKNFKESSKKTPEADTDTRTSVDAWGNVRSGDAAKNSTSKSSTSKSSAAKNSNSKTATSAKPPAASQ
jgi:hypothetical protein